MTSHLGVPCEKTVRIGAGSGFATDRIDPAVALVEGAGLDYLVFECLAERTIASGSARRLNNPEEGFDRLLTRRIRAVLPGARANGTRIVTNAGAANPRAAAQAVARVVTDLGYPDTRVFAVLGDDVLDKVRELDPHIWETNRKLSDHKEELVSANAYIGAESIVEALARGADIVIGGRIADPSLFLAPLIHEYGWAMSDLQHLGRGTMVGHLLECAGQLTGGYYADPITKKVDDLAHLGFPFADVERDGTAQFSKLPATGGLLTVRTCAEQLLYEVDNPHAYLTPDVVADFGAVTFTPTGDNTVRARGASGHARPETLKATLGFRDGWIGEGEISYAGPRAHERANLAAEIVATRLNEVHGLNGECVIEMIGAGDFRSMAPNQLCDRDIRLRVAMVTPTREAAETVGWEIESLYTNGPAGGGGARTTVTERLTIRSCVIPRSAINTRVEEIYA